MSEELIIQVKKGVPYKIEELDEVLDGASAHVTTTDESKLRVSVKRVSENAPGISSRVVDVTMCG
ncbi:MAG: hypothetical protein NTY50_11510 [Methylobacter sp.]|nr:hypothetical protein [Methylobacter sp.]